MFTTLLEGLALIDRTGMTILAATATTLVLGIVANLWLRLRYGALEEDLGRAREGEISFSHIVLKHIVHDTTDALRHAGEPNLQVIIEERFATDLRPWLLAERFVRSATGLVIILGLLGTFYGLTLSIGRIVHLVAVETSAAADISQGVSRGLTHALSGMAVAFSNSLVGVLSAVVLTVFGVLSNVTDKRTDVMVQIEGYLDRALVRSPPKGAIPLPYPDDFGLSVGRLDTAVARFESALQAFATTTRDFREFNAHLKDNISRLSLAFGELSDTLKTHIGLLRSAPKG